MTVGYSKKKMQGEFRKYPDTGDEEIDELVIKLNVEAYQCHQQKLQMLREKYEQDVVNLQKKWNDKRMEIHQKYCK